MPYALGENSTDWVTAGIDRVTEAGQQACARISAALDELERARSAWVSGGSLTDVVTGAVVAGMRETRLTSAEAFHEYERASLELRAHIVRSLVDDQRLSLTEVARRLEISRQGVARLYHRAAERPDHKAADTPAIGP
jgi:hypothetical protein